MEEDQQRPDEKKKKKKNAACIPVFSRHGGNEMPAEPPELRREIHVNIFTVRLQGIGWRSRASIL